MNSAPSSSGTGERGSCSVRIRPPTRGRASMTVTRRPACERSRAAASPAAPAPRIRTSTRLRSRGTPGIYNSARRAFSTSEFGTARAPKSRAARSPAASTWEPNANTGMPRATRSMIRADPSARPSSITASSNGSSRTGSPPAVRTTSCSLPRKNRSRHSTSTRLAIDWLDLYSRLCNGGPPPQIAQRRAFGEHQHGVAVRRVGETVQGEKRGRLHAGVRRAIPLAMPGEIAAPFEKHIVIDLEDPLRDPLARPIEHRIERLSFVSRDVLLRCPVIRLQRVDMSAELDMMAQLVGQRVPCFGAPIEIGALAGKRPERAVKQHDARVQVRAVAGPGERNTLAECVHVAVHGIGNRFGTDVDLGDAALELGGNVALQVLDEVAEVI